MRLKEIVVRRVVSPDRAAKDLKLVSVPAALNDLLGSVPGSTVQSGCLRQDVSDVVGLADRLAIIVQMVGRNQMAAVVFRCPFRGMISLGRPLLAFAGYVRIEIEAPMPLEVAGVSLTWSSHNGHPS